MLHLVLAFAVAATAAEQANLYAAPAQRVSVGGHRLNVVCEGSGKPVIVLDAGLGDWSPTWIRVQQRVASKATTCAYDRAGYGFSDPAGSPRTSMTIARELHGLLHAAKLPAPYVLVGHSFGGLNLQAFTELYRVEVAGLVLVDQTPDGVMMPAAITSLMNAQVAALDKCARAARAGAFTHDTPAFTQCFSMVWGSPASERDSGVTPQAVAAVKEQARKPAPYEAVISETKNEPASQREVQQHESPLGDLPLVVLTATTHGEDQMPSPLRESLQSFEPTWRAAHQRIAALSTRGRYELVKSGHYIQFDRPQAVIDAVEWVLRTMGPIR